MSTPLWQRSASELAAAYAKGETSPFEVAEELLARIERLDGDVGAFRDVLAEEALATARERTDELRRNRRRGPLHGIPVGIKELFDVAGADGCYGSEVFAGRIPDTDAEAVRRLRDAGAVILGVTRSHELGWGITTQHATLGSTRNPWDPDRVPGGSSGGSAAAIATGMVPVALGSDTGGSIRIPASYCGVAGLKPTYGRVSKRGAVSLAPSLDHPGPLARTVADLELGYLALAGYDADDPTTLRLAASGSAGAPDAGDLRVGLAPDLHLRELADDHQRLFSDAVAVAAEIAGKVTEVAIPDAAGIRPAFAAIQMAEAYHYHSQVLGTFPDRSAEYGPDVRHRLEMSADIGIADYLSARQEALAVRRRFDTALEQVNLLMTPVTAGGPSTVAAPDQASHRGRELPFRDVVMDYTVPQDLTGLPVCVIPVGRDDDGIPVAIQLTASHGREDLALAFAAALSARLAPLGWPPLAAT